MMHAEKKIKDTTDLIQSLLKVFSMSKTRIWYDTHNVKKNVSDALGIHCVKFDKVVGMNNKIKE